MTWLAIKLFLGGALKRLLSLLGTVADFARRYPWQAACIALLLALAWQTRGKSNAIEERDIARAETRAIVAEYEKAQLLAAAKQANADRREFALKSSLAEKADALSRSVAVASRSAVAAYARAHPVSLCRQAPDSAASGPGDINVPGYPGQPSDGTEGGELVAITRADLDILAEEAMQGAVRHRFLRSLVDAGLAIPQSKVELPMPELSVQP